MEEKKKPKGVSEDVRGHLHVLVLLRQAGRLLPLHPAHCKTEGLADLCGVKGFGNHC